MSAQVEGVRAERGVARTSVLLASSQVLLIVTALGFWAIAARMFDTAAYADGIALIQAVMFIGGLAKLNSNISMPAVLARRGRHATALLTKTLVVTSFVAAAGGVLYVAIAAATDLPSPPAALLIMPLSAAAWTVFTIQDGALAGVGRSEVVPIENTLYGFARVAVLVLAGTWMMGANAMLAGWVIPLFIAIPIVLRIVYRHELPKLVGDPNAVEMGATLVRKDAIGSLFSQALFRLVPIVAVLTVADPDDRAALTTAWLIFTVCDAFLATIGLGLSVTPNQDRRTAVRQALMLAATAAIGAAVSFLLFAPLALDILAPDFGARATGLLRLLALALVCRTPLHLTLAIERMAGRGDRLLRLQVLSGVALIVAIGWGLSTDDLSLLGWACLVATAVVLPPLVRPLRDELAPRSESARPDRFVPAPPGPAAILARRQDARTRLGLFAVTAGSALALIAARSVRYADVGGYGLIEAMPAGYWAATAAVLIGIALLLAGRPRLRWLAVPSLIAVTHLAGVVPHPHPRFSVAWTHLGFARFISESGATDVGIDARFAWPGFFAAVAGPLSVIGQTSTELFIRLWPVAIVSAGAFMTARIATRAYPETASIGTVTGLVFVTFSWTGQEYFSPQSLGFLAFLGVVLLVDIGGVRAGAALGGLRARLVSRIPEDEPGSTVVAIAVIVLIGFTVVSHPLSPAFVIIALFVLAAYKRQQAPGLLVIALLCFLTWVSFAAELWWRPRIVELYEQIGDITGSLSASTSERASKQTSIGHQRVVMVRIAMALGMWGWASLEALRTWRRSRADQRPLTPLFPLVVAPVLALPMQSYGGELLIRCFLFSSPFAAALIARNILAVSGRRWVGALTVLVALGITPFLLARFGNESFEMVVGQDRDAVEAMYDSIDDPDEAMFVSLVSQLAWEDRFQGQARFIELDVLEEPEGSDPDWLERIRDEAAEKDRTELRLLVTRSQEQYGIHFTGEDPGWSEEFVRQLLTRDGVSVLHQNDATWVLEIEPE